MRIPFVKPHERIENAISNLVLENISLKKHINEYKITESNFKISPVAFYTQSYLKDRLLSHLNFDNTCTTRVLVNEAIVNDLISLVYELSPEDRAQVENKMGKSIGSLPVIHEAMTEFKSLILGEVSATNEIVLAHLNSISSIEFDINKRGEIIEGLFSLYQNNYDFEAFCTKQEINPINVWYWFKESKVLPQSRAAEIVLEFLADVIRTLLWNDNDGIIPLIALQGEPHLAERLELYCLQHGFTSAQYMQLDSFIGRSVTEYLEHYFFNDLANLLNLIRHLPKTPYIWHLSSGEHQGFEVYVLIYKWNRDSLFKLKSQYISQRVQNLEYRQIQLQDVHTAQAQNEKEKIRLQLKEIEVFTRKIDELISEGYDPKLDDGVGKNIAPLQKKGLLRAEVLKSQGKNSQLEKYLHADW